jgi:peptidoglycan/xylan/chitin deacetylase (PgdA/CDA1 family)
VALRPIARHLVLSVGGTLLPPRNAAAEVRFFYGHSIGERDVPAFRRTMRMLRDRFELVSMPEAVTLARSPSPPGGRYLALSFDDGFRDNHDLLAPVLDEFGARACFFLPTRFIECDESYRVRFLRERLRVEDLSKRPLTWEMVRALAAAGFALGAHTADHVDLAACDPAEAETQMRASKRTIEERTGAPCDLFAWPYGLARHFPASLLPAAERLFSATFSAMRSATTFSYGGAVINRDHFEPGWPTSHVRFFARRRVALAAG